jgi:hypothetical protein
MARRPRLALTAAVCVIAATAWTFAQSKDPFVGTWELNVAKSKYSPGPAPKTASTTIDAAGSGYRFTVKQTSAKGEALSWSFTSSLDGKPSAVTGNNPNADSITLKRIDATTLETVATLKGKETQRQRNVVSADGKSRTVTTTGIDGAGQKISNVAVYEKK